MDILKVIGGFLLIVLTVLGILFGFSLLLAFPVKWLWNYLMPTVFGLIEITYFQAFSMLLLCGLLFKASVNKTSNEK